MSEEKQVPTDVKFDESDVERLSIYPHLADGYYKGVVRSVKNGVSKKGNIMQVLEVAPLDDADVPRRPTISLYLCPPINNPNLAGHVAPDWTVSKSQQYLRAVDAKNFPHFPKREGAVFTNEFGNTMSVEEASITKKKLILKIGQEMQRRWKDPNIYEGETFFFKVTTNVDDTGAERTNIDGVWSTLQKGETRITSNFGSKAKVG